MTVQVNVYEAKTKLSALLSKVAAGEDVIIARHGRPVARLVAVADRPARRTPGSWKSRVWIADDFDELDEQSLQDWYEGPVEPQ
jgi:prevent-host-death family protein